MNNVNPAEIAHFENIASDWWNLQGPCKPLHDLNPLRLQYVLQQTGSIAGKKILDIGCGGGILAESLAQQGAIVTGIDAAPGLIHAAQQHQAAQGLVIDYQVCQAEDYAQQWPQTFDIITCMEMLEHVPDPLSILKACACLLKPNGKLFLSTLNRNLKSFIYAIVGAEYLLKLIPQGTHQYQQFIRPAELAKWCRRTGLELRHLQGISYNPFTQITRLTSNIQVNYLAYCSLST